MIRFLECMYICIDLFINYFEWKVKYCILWLVCRLVVQVVCDMNVNEDKLFSLFGYFGVGYVRNLLLYICLKSIYQLFYLFFLELIIEGLF